MEIKLNRLVHEDPYVFTEGQVITFKVVETFDNVYHLREVLRDYTVQEGIEMVMVVNDPNGIFYKCREIGCP